MDDENLRRLVLQIETGRRQMGELNKQAQMVESAIVEINATVEALKALKDVKPGTEILVQVGSGAFIKAEVKDASSVLVGIGAEMSLAKKIPDAVEVLEGRKNQLSESLSAVQKTLGELGMKLAEMNAAAEQALGGQQ